MARLKFAIGEQGKWLRTAIIRSNLNLEEFAQICGVSSRTIRDWKREKYLISDKVAQTISNTFYLKIPKQITKIDDYWYVSKGAHIGGLKRFKLYGQLGDVASRVKGGIVSQLRRKQNPEKYRLLGCKVRKEFIQIKKSTKLAEKT